MVSQSVIDDLLAATSFDAQIARLNAAELLSSNGLVALLDAAEERIGSHLAQARQLAAIVCHAGERQQLPAVQARASYLQAHLLAMQGEFEQALELVDTAHDIYVSQGLTLEAKRTVVGRMRILGEMGQFADALQTGDDALHTLEEPVPAAPEAWRLLVGLLHQNCAICYTLTGRHEEALRACAAAEEHYRILDATVELADITVNRGLALKRLGRMREALDAFDVAAQTYAQDNLPLFQAQALINRGETLLLLSDYMQSLSAFSEAERLLNTEGLDDAIELADQPILLRQMGDVYLALNLYNEAADAYQLAEAALDAIGLAHHHALCLWGLGMARYGQKRWTEAGQWLEDAAARFRAVGNIPRLIDVQLEQVSLWVAQGDAKRANELIQETQEALQRGDWPMQQINAAMRHTDLVLLADPSDLDVASATLSAIQPLVAQIDLPHLRYQLLQRLGHLARLRGDDDNAQALLEQAIVAIEQICTTLLQERMRASFLDDKMDAYRELVELHLDRYRRDGDIHSFMMPSR